MGTPYKDLEFGFFQNLAIIRLRYFKMKKEKLDKVDDLKKYL